METGYDYYFKMKKTKLAMERLAGIESKPGLVTRTSWLWIYLMY